ncbi:MAG: DUF86 domain-containing protein [Thermomicrobiales bacterium]|nr:DUF86 domain-containing protein [Thermomicrobiales bacterium]
MRNVISHNYEVIEPKVIWIIVTQHLPPFHNTIKSALADLPPD